MSRSPAFLELDLTEARDDLDLANRERIVAAALRADDLIFSMPQPARHHTILHAVSAFKGGDLPIFCDQGFITSTGRYVDRTEGLRVAIAAKQIDGPKYQPHSLFSEDLW